MIDVTIETKPSLVEFATERLLFLQWLHDECRYRNIKVLAGERWAATMDLMFTCAIITGRMFDYENVSDRWCYHDKVSAAAALEIWSGDGEPAGWHRHPASGRRVKNDVEYIEP